MPIGYINSKWHISNPKSNRTCLIGYLGFISRKYVWPGGGHTQIHTRMHARTRTHTHTHTHTYTHTSWTKETRHVPGLKTIKSYHSVGKY